MPFFRCYSDVKFKTKRFKIIQAVVPHITVFVMDLRCDRIPAISYALGAQRIRIHLHLSYLLSPGIVPLLC
jgi:hypothetical protein